MESTDLKWRKASYSSNGGGECVEVGEAWRGVLVRDTKDRAGAVLRFSPDEWRWFVDRVKRSLADPQPRAFRGTHTSGGAPPAAAGGRFPLQARRGMSGKGWGARSAPRRRLRGPGCDLCRAPVPGAVLAGFLVREARCCMRPAGCLPRSSVRRELSCLHFPWPLVRLGPWSLLFPRSLVRSGTGRVFGETGNAAHSARTRGRCAVWVICDVCSYTAPCPQAGANVLIRSCR